MTELEYEAEEREFAVHAGDLGWTCDHINQIGFGETMYWWRHRKTRTDISISVFTAWPANWSWPSPAKIEDGNVEGNPLSYAVRASDRYRFRKMLKHLGLVNDYLGIETT